MNERRFKINDRVKRLGCSYMSVVHGGVYTVSGLASDDDMELQGCSGAYNPESFELVEAATEMKQGTVTIDKKMISNISTTTITINGDIDKAKIEAILGVLYS